MKLLSLGLFLLLPLSLFAFIHGIDDRKDISEVNNAQLIEWSKATATMISTSKINRVKDGIAIFRGRPLDFFEKNLCSDVPFQDQPSLGHCSGMLVAPNLLLTAGHCIHSKFSRGNAKCPSKPWVFGYNDSTLGKKVMLYDQEYDYEENFVEVHIPQDNLYRCKKVVAFDLTIGAPDNRYRDFALLELDRDVLGVDPVHVSNRRVVFEDEVLTFGYSLGLPVKLSDNASVYNDSLDNYFTTTLDVFQNNSGGAVIDPSQGKVVGIVVKGIKDFISKSSRACYSSYQAFEGEALAKIQRIPDEVLQALGSKKIRPRRR